MAIIFQGFLEIARRANITSFTTDIYPSQPPYIDLNPNVMNWAISFNPSSLNTWGDIGKFFKVEVFQVTNTRDKLGNSVKKKVLLELLPCKMENFNTNAQIELMGFTSNISSLLCTKMDDKIFVEGKFSS